MNFTSDVLDEAYILILIKILSWYPNTDFFLIIPNITLIIHKNHNRTHKSNHAMNYWTFTTRLNNLVVGDQKNHLFQEKSLPSLIYHTV